MTRNQAVSRTQGTAALEGPRSDRTAARRPARIGCVSFLNAKPLIEGLSPDVGEAVLDVPSRLLAGLESRQVDVALCPVIDYYRSRVPLRLLPVGGISCEGPTLTVRLFSRVPPEAIRCVHVDTDSHTSVVLLQVLLAQRYGVRPRIVDLPAAANSGGPDPEAMLLIGDKVVLSPPSDDSMPHQFDLGQWWFEQTALPFVFAVWMCRDGTETGGLQAALESVRRANTRRIDDLAARHAPAHGWPTDLARKYLGRLLQYETGPRHLAAVERFAALAAELKLIDSPGPLRIAAPS